MAEGFSPTLELLRLERRGDDEFRGSQPRRTALPQVFGGQVAAQLLAAAIETVDDDRSLHALHAQFLRRGDATEPIDLHVTRPLEGGSFSVRQVTAVQAHGPLATATASFHRPEAGFAHQSAMPDVPGPQDCRPLFDVALTNSRIPAQEWRREFGAFDLRHVPDTRDADSIAREGAIQRIWFRFVDPVPSQGIVPEVLLAYISDFSLLSASLVVHGYMLGDPEIQRSTLNHSLWLHAKVAPSEWMLYDQASAWSGRARGLSTARIYGADGRLVASAAQEGLVRPRGSVREQLGLPHR